MIGKLTVLAVGALLLVGCATHRIPTPYGDMVYMALLMGRELPTGTYSVTVASPTGVSTTAMIRVEGYKSYPDTEAIKATGESGGEVLGVASGTAAKIILKKP